MIIDKLEEVAHNLVFIHLQATYSLVQLQALIVFPPPKDISSSMTNSTATSKPPVTLRIVVPASQCGSLIGKGGCKIKEIREVWLQIQISFIK